MELTTGLKGKVTNKVTKVDTAAEVKSGLLPVFATPALAAMLESAACAALEGCIEEGKTTVGTKLNIEHLAPTPTGMTVTAIATLTEVDRRRLSFVVEAYDDCELICRGTHERFIVDIERFMAKAEAKKGN